MSQTPNTRILFLARRYPPSIGGVQNHCYQLYKRLSQQRKVKLIALGRETLLHLIWFVPYTFLISFFEVLFRHVDVIYFSDGVICVLAPFLRPFTRARFVVTIYGLEMTYSSYFFGSLMKWGVKYCEKVAVISEITRDVTHQSGVPLNKIAIIYLGIEPPVLPEDQRKIRKEQFEKEHEERTAEFTRDEKECQESIERVKKGRQEIIQQVPPDIRSQYERIVERKQGLALVEATGENCGACQFQLRPQVINELLLGESVVVCENCSRILYIKK